MKRLVFLPIDGATQNVINLAASTTSIANNAQPDDVTKCFVLYIVPRAIVVERVRKEDGNVENVESGFIMGEWCAVRQW